MSEQGCSASEKPSDTATTNRMEFRKLRRGVTIIDNETRDMVYLTRDEAAALRDFLNKVLL